MSCESHHPPTHLLAHTCLGGAGADPPPACLLLLVCGACSRDALLEHMAKVMALASGASSSSSPASPSSLARQASDLTDRFTRSWQEEVGASPASREAMWSLCKRYGLGLAYWKIRPERASVDGLWSRVARAVDRGRLGHEARCRTFRRRSAEVEVVAVSEVSFAVFPFWDRSQVERILVAVRQEVGYHDAALLVADAAGQYCDGDDDTLQVGGPDDDQASLLPLLCCARVEGN